MLNDFKIGHYTDSINGTGVTVIINTKGAVAGCCVRGASPATRETDLLADGKTVQTINAVVLSGGSAFGLEAACGVVKWLYDGNFGYNAGKYRVPIVVGASLYDLEFKNFAYPDKTAGFDACQAAKTDNFQIGSIGAGTGATVSKIFGTLNASKSGIGISLFSLNGLEVAVITAVNALGDIVQNGQIILGAKDEKGKFVDCKSVMSAGSINLTQINTTIGCILTNAIITKEQANILASIAHDGFALALSPSHTLYDGDCMFVASSCKTQIEFNILSTIIPDLTARSIQSVAQSESDIITHSVNPIALKLFKKAFRSRK
ncbi:MAG: P1 family peptidase [Christensenellaceae bacterium]|jgi:L-aminopeptidase/D-esterase-like protein|nr:P1 family peptidase [Christensenellaceae bacterium]